MNKKNTYTRAFEACEESFSESGTMPTIESIKLIIGTNSPTIISSAIKDWKTALAQTVRHDQGINPGLPKSLLEAVNGLWKQALAEANETLHEKSTSLQIKQKALDGKSAHLDLETERVKQLVQLTEQKFSEEINYLNKEIDRLTTETITLKEQANQDRETTILIEKKNAVLTEENKQEKEKFNRLETQYDKEHDWALMRIAEEKESYRAQTQNEMNRLKTDNTRSKQSLEALQAKVNLMSNQAIIDRDKIINLERNLSEEKLQLAGLTLNAAKLQNEINAKDKQISLLMAKNKKPLKHKSDIK